MKMILAINLLQTMQLIQVEKKFEKLYFPFFFSKNFPNLLNDPSIIHTEEWVCRGVMVNMLDCDIVVREFKLQSSIYVHFQNGTLGEMYELPYPSNYELNCIHTILIDRPIDIMVSVHQWSGRPGFNPWSSHAKTQKWLLMLFA